MIVQRLHESNVVRAGQLVGSTPDYWFGSGLTNRTVSSGLVPKLLSILIYCIYIQCTGRKLSVRVPYTVKCDKSSCKYIRIAVCTCLDEQGLVVNETVECICNRMDGCGIRD